MIDLTGYLIVGLCAAVVTAILTPLVERYARKRRWMAEPDTLFQLQMLVDWRLWVDSLQHSYVRGEWIASRRSFLVTLN